MPLLSGKSSFTSMTINETALRITDGQVRKVSNRFKTLASITVSYVGGRRQAHAAWTRRKIFNPEYRDLGAGFAKGRKGVTRCALVLGAAR